MIMPVRPKIFTGKTVAEELSEDFRVEIAGMLKQVAHDNHCEIEDLKFTINNMGVVNIQNMTAEDKAAEAEKLSINQDLKTYRKLKGFKDG